LLPEAFLSESGDSGPRRWEFAEAGDLSAKPEWQTTFSGSFFLKGGVAWLEGA